MIIKTWDTFFPEPTLSKLTITSGLASGMEVDVAYGNPIALTGVRDGSITEEKVADHAITDSKVFRWLVGRLATEFPPTPVDGESVYRTDLNTAYRYYLATDTWVAVDAILDNSRLGTDVVNTANIVDAAITSALIANLAVGSAKIEDLAVTDAKINSLGVNKITAGTLAVAISVGVGDFLKIDGVNKRIMINDGTYDTIAIGNLTFT